MHLVSRFPILEPSGSNGDWAYLLLAPGEVAAIANTHLTCCPYTPYRIVNRGFGRAEAMAQERRTRLDQIRDHLSALEPLLSGGRADVLHRRLQRALVPRLDPGRGSRARASVHDALAGLARDGGGRVPGLVPRGVSRPVADPGFTWTAGYPAPVRLPLGGVRPDRLRLGRGSGRDEREPGHRRVARERGHPDPPLALRTTGAVASSFTVTPAPMPVSVVAEGESARLGLPLRARFHAEGPGDHVILTASGSTTPLADLPAGPDPDGTVAFDTTQLEQGAYDVVLLDATDAELSRDTVVLIAEGQQTTLTGRDPTLEGDQRLEVGWAFAPGNQFDWLAVFRAGHLGERGPRTWPGGTRRLGSTGACRSDRAPADPRRGR